MLLAIETCFNKCSVCLYINGKLHEKIDETRNNHTNSLPQFTQDLLDEHKIKVQDLDGIVVNHGPGSFTGIRIGIAFAMGLATPLKLPLYGISTLESFVLDVSPKAIAVRAIKDFVYFQTFKNGVAIGEIEHIEFKKVAHIPNILRIGFEENSLDTPTAKQLITRFLFKKPEIYSEPLYVRPVNAIVGEIKNIKQ